MAGETIRNPSNHDHFMQLDRLNQRVRIAFDGMDIAVSDGAIRLLEHGRRLYQPQYYVPHADIDVQLVRSDRATHCPLKGNATYFSLRDEDGQVTADNLGWSYEDPYDFAVALSGYVAFDPQRVSITVEAADTRDT
ncbi:MAG: DUF427 domain-containing protein [Alphaproteobacteria bacterium]|nr:DUF427 domain-containing protein [Alphaproteobacteria bacterium]